MRERFDPVFGTAGDGRPDVLFLVGMRAAGKTTLGRALADRLGWIFRDTDALIRQEAGSDVADIVAAEGWKGFRDREAQALRRAVDPHVVVATGGGAVLRADNREFMRGAGMCVYLEADSDLLCRRLALDPRHRQRPPLKGAFSPPRPEAERNSAEAARRAEVEAVLAERQSLYREVAHHVVSAALPLPELTRVITDLMRGKPSGLEKKSSDRLDRSAFFKEGSS